MLSTFALSVRTSRFSALKKTKTQLRKALRNARCGYRLARLCVEAGFLKASELSKPDIGYAPSRVRRFIK